MIEVFRGLVRDQWSGGLSKKSSDFPPGPRVSNFHSFLFLGKTEKFIHLQVEDLNLRAGKN